MTRINVLKIARQGINTYMEDLIKRQKEIEEAPDTMFINGIEYRKVIPVKEKLTLADIIKKWEFNFTRVWETENNRNCDVYNNEIERLVQMIEDWLPEEKDNPYDMPDEQRTLNAGWNWYRRNLVKEFR